jgi:redox-sensitive bicupin YhaK (pirin superfamily)
MSIRPVKRLIQSKPTLEGAGVHLRRAFGFDNTSEFDPFLLLDDFRNDVPADYLAGFPWHPHRGIETVTYVLAGTVEHSDSMGNHGAIGAGDIQWMTAGSGIIHQEMPKGDPAGRMHGFQLWANLPSAQKMTPPRYQEVKAVRHAFAYVFGGSGKFCNASGPLAVPTEGVKWLDTNPPSVVNDRSLVLFDSGDEITVQAGDEGIRFLLVSGRPLQEPVAWYGPIVMNTQEQLQQAFSEPERGKFLKQP